MEQVKRKKTKNLQKYSTYFILLSFVGLIVSAFVIYFSVSIGWLQKVGWGILVISMLCYGFGRILQIMVRNSRKSSK